MKHFVYGLQAEFKLSDYEPEFDIDEDEYNKYYRYKIYAISLSKKNLINLEEKNIIESDYYFKQWKYVQMEVYLLNSDGNMTIHNGRIKTKTHKLILFKQDDNREALLYFKRDDKISQENNIEFDIFYLNGI